MNQEREMGKAAILSIVLGLAATPLAASPHDKAAVRIHLTVHFREAKFAKATALAASAAPAVASQVILHTDGLSREAEDCNVGCIDH
jgi:hypothetical protein